MSLNFVSLFAGIGGFDLGLELAGMRCVGQVEIDPHASAVLAHHWPEVPRHDDITTAISSGWADELVRLSGSIDLVCGGFPCQPFSVAGKRLAREDLRGNLFWNALEFAHHIDARWLLFENVPGLLTAGNPSGQVFADILQSLDDYGFDADWHVLDSQDFGVPQRRRRLFIAAHRRSAAPRGRSVFVEPEGMSWHPPTLRATGAHTPRRAEDGAGAGGSGVRGGVLADSGVTQALTQGLASGGPDAAHAQAGWLVPEVDGCYWDGGQISDCLDVSMLVKGQMLPEKRRMPAVLVREDAADV